MWLNRIRPPFTECAGRRRCGYTLRGISEGEILAYCRAASFVVRLLPNLPGAQATAWRKAGRYERIRFLQFRLVDSVRIDLLVVRAALVTAPRSHG